jgi:hypothetical protein
MAMVVPIVKPKQKEEKKSERFMFRVDQLKDNDAHCLEFYGFTGPQLETFLGAIKTLNNPDVEAGKLSGPKPTYDEKVSSPG